MTVGIVGLGLIGGSFAKAYHEAGETVLACNRTEDTLRFAMLSGAVDGELTEENIGSCDLVIIAVFPEAAEAFLRRMAPHIGKKPVVIDACGTKRKICSMCFPIAEEYGFTYLVATQWRARTNRASNTQGQTFSTMRPWSSYRRLLTILSY